MEPVPQECTPGHIQWKGTTGDTILLRVFFWEEQKADEYP